MSESSSSSSRSSRRQFCLREIKERLKQLIHQYNPDIETVLPDLATIQDASSAFVDLIDSLVPQIVVDEDENGDGFILRIPHQFQRKGIVTS